MNELLQRHIAGHSRGGATNKNSATAGELYGGHSSFSAAAAAGSGNFNNNNNNNMNNTDSAVGSINNSSYAGGPGTGDVGNLNNLGIRVPSYLQANHPAFAMGFNNNNNHNHHYNMNDSNKTPAPSAGMGEGGGFNAGHYDEHRWRRNSSLGFGRLADFLGRPSLSLGPHPTSANNIQHNNNSFANNNNAADAIDRRSSLALLGETAAVLDQHRRGKKRRQNPVKTSNSIDPLPYQDSFNDNSKQLLTEIDLVKRKADLELALQRNEAELLKAQKQREMAMQQQEQQQQQKQQQQTEPSNDLEQLDGQRRNSLKKALQLQWQEQETQRRNSLELMLQQQRKNSLDFERRDSFGLGRRSSLGDVDLDHLFARRNSTAFFQGNTDDALMKAMFAEHLFGDNRRSSLSMARRLSNLQMGMNPIDPNHLDSLFDDGKQAGRGSLGFQKEADALLLALRRQSLLQSMDQASAGASNIQSFSNQSPFFSTPLASQQQQSQQTTASMTNTSNIINSNDQLELLPEQAPIFLSAVKCLQEKMQQSQVSQKNIQAWDKKMGLKRSHSSTMTNTHRSRKQLRELFEVQKKVLEQKLGIDNKAIKKSSSQKKKSKSSKKRKTTLD